MVIATFISSISDLHLLMVNEVEVGRLWKQEGFELKSTKQEV